MATNQFLHSSGIAPSAAAVSYMPLLGFGGTTPSATELNMTAIVGAAGTFKSIKAYVTVAPGGVASRQFQLSVNGTPSALDVTITGAATTATLTTDVAVSAGDRVVIKMTPSGTPAGSSPRVLLEFAPTTTDNFTYPGGCDGTVAAAARYAPLLNFRTAWQTTDTDAVTRSLCPIGGQITQFYINLTVAPGAGTSYDFVIAINGTEQAASQINIAGTATTGSLTGLTIAVAQGDKLTFKVKTRTGAAATTRPRWGVVIVPTNTGEFILNGSAGGGTINNAATEYQLFTPTTTDGDNVEGRWQVDNYLSPSLTLFGLTIALVTAPGAAKSWTFNSRKDTAPGNQSVAISGAVATTGTDNVNTDVLATSSLWSLQVVPASTPASTSAMWAIGAKFAAVTSRITLPLVGVGL